MPAETGGDAKARADSDLQWKVALGSGIEDRPFAKSTLQVFRSQLLLHGKVREMFGTSLRLAWQWGYLKKAGCRWGLDTTGDTTTVAGALRRRPASASA